jgi:hypothetical protein
MLLPSSSSSTPNTNSVETDNTISGIQLPSTSADHISLLGPTATARGATGGGSSSNSPSKQSSLIGLGLSSGSVITSALPNLSLTFPGSSKSTSSAKPNPANASASHIGGATPALRPAGLVGKVEPKGETGFTVYAGDRAVVYNVDAYVTMTEWVDRLKAGMESR